MAIKILVVDDELDVEMLIRQKFRKQIKENIYEFVFALNGVEALSLLSQQYDIRLILSDINMPEMDGLTLLAKVKELDRPFLKTVIVTAYGDMENIRTAMNRDSFDFVTKPIDFDDLEITIKKALEHIDKLYQAMIEHDQLISITQDLNIAREIQQSLLPKVFPPFPERKDFDIFATMEPAKSVGGDFYDFFLIENDLLGFVIADVSDKGVPAALFMAISRTLIRATALKGFPPNECMQYSNDLLCKESVNGMFVTVFYGILNTKTGEIQYSNAGHCPPYILYTDGNIKKLDSTDDIVLGIMENKKYNIKSAILSPGDVLFLYTDGITEAMDNNKEIYSEKRLEESLSKLKDTNCKKIIDNIVADVKRYSENTEQSDDITLLSIRYHGNN